MTHTPLGGPPQTNKPNWLARIGAALGLSAAIVAGLALSAFFLGFFLVLAALIAMWVGWQRWKIKKHLRRQAAERGNNNPAVIQGEYEVVEDTIKPRQHDR